MTAPAIESHLPDVYPPANQAEVEQSESALQTVVENLREVAGQVREAAMSDVDSRTISAADVISGAYAPPIDDYQVVDAVNNLDITEALRYGGYSTEQLNVVLATVNDIEASSSLAFDDVSNEVINQKVMNTLSCIPQSELQAAFYSDDGAEGHNPLRRIISARIHHEPADEVRTMDAANLLAKAYGGDLANLQEQRDQLQDPLVDQVLQSENVQQGVEESYVTRRYAKINDCTPGFHSSEGSPADYNDEVLRRSSQFLGQELQLPSKLVDDWLSDATPRLKNSRRNAESGQLDSDETIDYKNLRQLLQRANSIVSKVGAENIARLHEQCGYVNLDYYSADMCKNMLKLVDKDDEYLEQLKTGDVTVVFNNTSGDYNSAMSKPESQFSNGNGHTLVFEIRQPSDYMRYMLLLRDRDIKPSTAVVSSHSQPGIIDHGDKEKPYLLTNYQISESSRQLNETDKKKSRVSALGARALRATSRTFSEASQIGTGNPNAFSIVDAPGIRRMLTDFMQDSRGIDDDPEAAGRRRLILASCNSATEAAVRRGKYDQKSAQESFAETLAQTAGLQNMDVYGASFVATIQETDYGVGFEEKIGENEGKAEWRTADATRISLDVNGKPIKEKVEHINLWRNKRKK